MAYDSNTNRITTSGFVYDAAGNQIEGFAADGTPLDFEYDAANRIQVIKKQSDSSYVQAFQYGSTNARLMDLDYAYGYLKLFASIGGTTHAEYTEFAGAVPTWTKGYTYLGSSQLGTINPDGTGGEYVDFNHPDRLGTKIQTNQALGTSSEQNTLPFGTDLNAESSLTTNNKRFTSYDRSNSTGLDYAVNRTYDSKQGRFTQVDPIGMSAASLTSPQTLNMYTYCGNDPVNYVDPSGLFFGKLFRWIAKIFRAVVEVLKWVVVAVVVITVAIAIFKSGGAASVFLSKILGLVGKILGLKTIKTAMIIKNLAGVAVGYTVKTSTVIGLSGKLIGAFMSVGAIANSFSSTGRGGKETKEQRKRRIIESSANSALWRINNMPGCKEFLQEGNIDYDPEGILIILRDLKRLQPNNLPSPPVALSPPAGSGSAGTPTYLSDEWFDGKTVGGWTTFLGMNQTNVRTLILLHEIKHRVGGSHDDLTKIGSKKNDEYYNKGIAEHCFGVK